MPVVSCYVLQENEDLQDDPAAAEATSHPDADTTIVFVTGEGERLEASYDS